MSMANLMAKAKGSGSTSLTSQASAVRHAVWLDLDPLRDALIAQNLRYEEARRSSRKTLMKAPAKKMAVKKATPKKAAAKKTMRKSPAR
jgi:hypothetical protein